MGQSLVVDLDEGFEIEDPAVSIPWGVSEDQLLQVLPVRPRRVTSGYYVVTCTSVGGLQHQLGFHFRPRRDGRLVELELFHADARDLRETFAEFQRHLEGTFGSPTSVGVGDADLPAYEWKLGRVRVRHLVFERFGPEEHVRIERL